MSRKVARCRARVSELVDELAIGAALRLRLDSDDIRPVVEAVVAYLVEEYPSQDLYIPASASEPQYPVAEIRAALQGGKSIRAICREFRMSRRTLYAVIDAEDGRATPTEQRAA
jgi:Mor family transcriptional regulator